MFSKSCEYGIRAVIYIAAESSKGRHAGITDIVKEINAPLHFTAKVLQNLSRVGLIESQKGPHGGFYLNKRKEVMLIDVVKAIDGDDIFNGCGLGLSKCSETKPCPLHHYFKSIRDDLKQMLQTTSIRELALGLDKNLVFLKK